VVVEDDPEELSDLLHVLSSAGYEPAGAQSFHDGVQLLSSTQPDVLISEVRLGAFNGLHLVVRGRSERPDMAAIIISGFPDEFLEKEARRFGARAHLVKPFDSSELLAAIQRSLARDRERRRSPRKRVTGGLVATLRGERVEIVDVSYDGLRLELPRTDGTQIPVAFVIDLISVHRALDVDFVWQSVTPEQSVRVGVAIAFGDPVAARAWEGIVDDLPG
jgi:DNA-binding response OmpR family regulator